MPKERNVLKGLWSLGARVEQAPNAALHRGQHAYVMSIEVERKTDEAQEEALRGSGGSTLSRKTAYRVEKREIYTYVGCSKSPATKGVLESENVYC